MTGTATLSAKDFTMIATMMRDLSGVDLAEGKRAMVAARLGRRIRALNLSGFPAYCDLLNSPSGASERNELIKALTTNTTRFNRERQQLDHFASEVLPDLVARARAGGRVRLWSAGCSTGEEPFSLAFRVLDQCSNAASLDFKILATDIDQQVLAKAKSAQYGQSGLEVVDKQHVEKYFAPGVPGSLARQVGAEARAMITFRLSNLMEPWPFTGPFDMIMCRNVFIYFDRETQDRLWPRLAGMLSNGGMLYIGHSETINHSENLGLGSDGRGIFQMKNGSVLARAARTATTI